MFKTPRGIAGLSIVVGILMLLMGGPLLSTAIDVQFDRGVPGAYVIDDEPTCARGPNQCTSHRGTFTSDDSAVTRTVELPGFLPVGYGRGDRLRAFDVGDPLAVYAKETDGYPIAFAFMTCGLGPLLILFGGLYLWRHRDQS